MRLEKGKVYQDGRGRQWRITAERQTMSGHWMVGESWNDKRYDVRHFSPDGFPMSGNRPLREESQMNLVCEVPA